MLKVFLQSQLIMSSNYLFTSASEPKCFVNGMPVTSNLIVVNDEEYVEMKCNLTFAGRWSPSVEWIQQINSENDWMAIANQQETEKRDNLCFTSTTLDFNATHNSTSFMCTTRFLEHNRPKTTTAENILEYSYNWTSPTFVLRCKLTGYFVYYRAYTRHISMPRTKWSFLLYGWQLFINNLRRPNCSLATISLTTLIQHINYWNGLSYTMHQISRVDFKLLYVISPTLV